ncbi:MAG: pyridoxine 5-phosphate synthase [Candidatus Omnitrophota bacterium]|jgi:pyridoxine 5-phosphate synthase
MAYLGVNVDHVATLRQARGHIYPSPVEAALRCQAAGADSIVVHLREDRRHIQDSDLEELKRKLTIKLNLEMSVDPSIVEIALRTKPDAVTLVPEKREERTTESGLNVIAMLDQIKDLAKKFKAQEISLSLFVDPQTNQIIAAKESGAEAIEIHTGDYANATGIEHKSKCIRDISDAIQTGKELGLMVHVGHGLDYDNVEDIAALEGISEFNIGFAIIAEAIFSGLDDSVRRMHEAIQPKKTI